MRHKRLPAMLLFTVINFYVISFPLMFIKFYFKLFLLLFFIMRDDKFSLAGGYEAMLTAYQKIAPHLNEPLYTRPVRTVV